MLLEANPEKINILYSAIHEIFGNSLFADPKIEVQYLNKEVCDLIYLSISGTNTSTKQLSLFDFQFNVIPTEFISYIYEVFLIEGRKGGGIYYTPKKLAQLIIDEVLLDGNIGTVLDPACGSGMFLIMAFQRLMENFPCSSINVAAKIEHRLKLLTENIFGIEKEVIARRFTVFSLSLQIFKDIEPNEIKVYIANELMINKRVDLFGKYNFSKNIKQANTLDLKNPIFADHYFDYIVGNPPFLEVKPGSDELPYISSGKVSCFGKLIPVSSIVGRNQISQCFLIKIKEWCRENTRLGFITNSSNFYNDKSKSFQQFIYINYNIEKFYELSKVKDILFENAKESVIAIIFSEKIKNDNIIKYFPVEMSVFSFKKFGFLIINENKYMLIKQANLRDSSVQLRHFQLGNQNDIELVKKISDKGSLFDYLLINDDKKPFIHEGLKIVGEESVLKEFVLTKEYWTNLNKKQKEAYFDRFKEKYTKSTRSDEFQNLVLGSADVEQFTYNNGTCFIGENIENFERQRDVAIFKGDRIIFKRTGDRICAFYTNSFLHFDSNLHVLKLQDKQLYYFVTAILNSWLTNYFIDIYFRKRIDGNYPKIGNDDICKLSIPKRHDEYLFQEISQLSKDLTEGICKYEDEISIRMNNLIFDLFDLGYLEKQRIRDFFLKSEKVNEPALNLYSNVLKDSISIFFKNQIVIETCQDKNIVVIKVRLNEALDKTPTPRHTLMYILNEIFTQSNNKSSFLALPEMRWAKECVYIIRNNDVGNWTETKAWEDGQEIIKRIK